MFETSLPVSPATCRRMQSTELQTSHATSDMNDCDHSHLLSDEQMRSYLTEGFLVLKSRLPQDVHDYIRDRCEEICLTTGSPGNGILEMILVLQLVFADPAVKSALN